MTALFIKRTAVNNTKTAKNRTQQLLLAWSFPVLVFIMQTAHPVAMLIGCPVLLVCAVIFPALRAVLLILGFMVIGHLFWVCTSQYIANSFSLSPFQVKTLGPFGLLGYFTLFAIWHCVQKPQNRFIRIGDGFPLFGKA
jgi:hypothetical protein